MKALCWLKQKVALTLSAAVLFVLGLGLALFLFLKTLSEIDHEPQDFPR